MHAQAPRSMLAKASDILGVFSVEQPVLTQAEITRRANLPHSTTRRLLVEMVEHGLLEKTADAGFVLGLRLWELGSISHRVLSLRDTAMPFMTVLNQALGQHVQLAVQEGNEAAIVERLSATNAIALQLELRNRVPLHASGAGKALLAFARDADVEAFLSQPLAEFTPKTIIEPHRLRQDLESIRHRGFAVVREETQLGVNAVAAPVINRRRQVIASLSIVLPTDLTDPEKLVQGVRAAAKAISAAL